MQDIKVSVIVPVYKVPLEYLRDCLDSLKDQTLQECEFIVVSDGAPDAECSVCEEYASKDSRFKFFKRNHAGVSATRNFGLKQACGEYIAFVDSDDWVDKGIFEEAFAFSQKTNSDVTFWNYVKVSPNKSQPVKFSTTDSNFLSNKILSSIKENLCFVANESFSNFIFLFGKLYKSSLIKDMRFDESLEIGEDRVFNFQVFSKNTHLIHLDRDSYFHRQNALSITRRYRNNAFEAFSKHMKILDKLAYGKYHKEICNEILFLFDQSLYLDFFHKDNPHSFKYNINRVKKIFYSEQFQSFIKDCSFRKLNLFHKTGYLCINNKLFFWIYIRIIMFTIKREIFNCKLPHNCKHPV
jgi:glycosyltransferase involved in cell wall biosynthesis